MKMKTQILFLIMILICFTACNKKEHTSPSGTDGWLTGTQNGRLQQDNGRSILPLQ